jgi:hypothetical protein
LDLRLACRRHPRPRVSAGGSRTKIGRRTGKIETVWKRMRITNLPVSDRAVEVIIIPMPEVVAAVYSIKILIATAATWIFAAAPTQQPNELGGFRIRLICPTLTRICHSRFTQNITDERHPVVPSHHRRCAQRAHAAGIGVRVAGREPDVGDVADRSVTRIVSRRSRRSKTRVVKSKYPPAKPGALKM